LNYMTTYTADWILPIAGPPIRNGAITIDEGRIVAVSQSPDPRSVAPSQRRTLGSVAILPALINAHTHLELSYLSGHVPRSTSFNDWVMKLMTLRRGSPDSGPPPIREAASQAIAQARATGTGLIGDVSNTLVTVPLLREASMPAQVFHELTGFNHPDPVGRVREARASVETAGVDGGNVRLSLAPHAPYSVSPALFTAIRDDVDAHPHAVTTVHLGESAAEVEFLRQGTGAARTMLERLGVWTHNWQVPGVSPTEYLAGLGFLEPHTLLVHGVQFDGEDLARVKARGSTLVSCPRSNAYVGVGAPPLESFYAAGVPVAFGTDSLASVADLNMFAELAEARRIAPGVPARELLRSATLEGASALRFDEDYGSIEVGKRAALIAVQVPARIDDVEEYLVGGVEPAAITWLDAVSTPNAPTPNSR
jgi:cytosine/adenosine deaminase-related metal-dependent hydrolase